MEMDPVREAAAKIKPRPGTKLEGPPKSARFEMRMTEEEKDKLTKAAAAEMPPKSLAEFLLLAGHYLANERARKKRRRKVGGNGTDSARSGA